MGMFVQGDLARKIKWLEDLTVYEDLEYFILLRTHGSSTKLPIPLVTIDQLAVSSDKDLGKDEANHAWRAITRFWKEHGKRVLDPEVLSFRNEVRTRAGFYGV